MFPGSLLPGSGSDPKAIPQHHQQQQQQHHHPLYQSPLRGAVIPAHAHAHIQPPPRSQQPALIAVAGVQQKRVSPGPSVRPSNTAAGPHPNSSQGFDAPEPAIKYSFDQATSQWSQAVVTVQLNAQPFAEGTMRRVYHLLDHSLPSGKDGKDVFGEGGGASRHCIAKLSKLGDPKEAYFEDAKMQAKCTWLAGHYNATDPPKKIKFLPAYVIEFQRRAHPLGPGRGSLVMLVEPFLKGRYRKFSNNFGFVDEADTRPTPQAFSHFTYCFSRGELLVVDLQGVDETYTDPQIHSSTQKGLVYGKGDMGLPGFEKFFQSHRCNSICGSLGLPPPVAGQKQLPPAVIQPRVRRPASQRVTSPMPSNVPIVEVVEGNGAPSEGTSSGRSSQTPERISSPLRPRNEPSLATTFTLAKKEPGHQQEGPQLPQRVTPPAAVSAAPAAPTPVGSSAPHSAGTYNAVALPSPTGHSAYGRARTREPENRTSALATATVTTRVTYRDPVTHEPVDMEAIQRELNELRATDFELNHEAITATVAATHPLPQLHILEPPSPLVSHPAPPLQQPAKAQPSMDIEMPTPLVLDDTPYDFAASWLDNDFFASMRLDFGSSPSATPATSAGAPTPAAPTPAPMSAAGTENQRQFEFPASDDALPPSLRPAHPGVAWPTRALHEAQTQTRPPAKAIPVHSIPKPPVDPRNRRSPSPQQRTSGNASPTAGGQEKGREKRDRHTSGYRSSRKSRDKEKDKRKATFVAASVPPIAVPAHLETEAGRRTSPVSPPGSAGSTYRAMTASPTSGTITYRVRKKVAMERVVITQWHTPPQSQGRRLSASATLSAPPLPLVHTGPSMRSHSVGSPRQLARAQSGKTGGAYSSRREPYLASERNPEPQIVRRYRCEACQSCTLVESPAPLPPTHWILGTCTCGAMGHFACLGAE
eukprot:TRINITY_DN1369_c0_g2_i1.p1 TRINITY_DN1369_c0_g2~~TRINITY_DN1369_c0_g2_i1.p1  ORF type:complete len:928 (-),score=75.72 TRINITY_DN1369_c0_g2_i1:170-2953(-)